MRFTKMQGLGNDYIYVYGEVPGSAAELSVRLSDRHFGVGADGMIYISPSPVVDFRMRVFNADGSEALMCGNGIRCVGKFVYDKGYTDKTTLKIETLSGVRTVNLHVTDGYVASASVDMGAAVVGEDMTLAVDETTVTCTPVSVGNPHAVLFVDDAEQAPVNTVGPLLEHDAAFPGGVNVEFVQILGDQALRMRIWERGSGVTMACGTGACASAAAAVHKGYCRADQPVTVILDGGPLAVTVGADFEIIMNGSAVTVYEGEIERL